MKDNYKKGRAAFVIRRDMIIPVIITEVREQACIVKNCSNTAKYICQKKDIFFTPTEANKARERKDWQ